ncbi:hypothetical protein LZF95_21245 [Algoriphagus sp. AGSA1]|uniref:group II intron maturase-specific domain-containing protein n=1 Tax=Algoriphagus sp. AGSA1 TaxID=2907213 RepID=UPI001F37EAF4|nr:group II intron maturase-specific domain-containing protein [Algoriphagus sp. AGSA1]MCE7057221.1 hypothetical protein [Algoriphagus sp. AGSA1]
MDFHRESTWALQDIAKMINTQSKGLVNYFGKMGTRMLEKLFRHWDYRIAKWIKNKLKRLRSYPKSIRLVARHQVELPQPVCTLVNE